MPTGESCQNLYTGPQMVLADVVQEVSVGAGTTGVRSSVDQVLSDECTRTGTELATSAIAQMDLSSQGMMIPGGTNASTNVREFLQEVVVSADALMPRAEAPQQSVAGDDLTVVESTAADTGHSDTRIPQSRPRDRTRDPVEIGPTGGYGPGPGPSHGQRMKYKPEKYDDTADWADYLRHFEVVSAWNEWSLEDRAVQLSMNLTGVAREAWADSFCDQTSPISYDALVSALTQRFKPEGQEEVYKAEFRHRMRKMRRIS